MDKHRADESVHAFPDCITYMDNEIIVVIFESTISHAVPFRSKLHYWNGHYLWYFSIQRMNKS